MLKFMFQYIFPRNSFQKTLYCLEGDDIRHAPFVCFSGSIFFSVHQLREAGPH